MPEEEAEFEISRRIVRLMAAAALDAAQAPRRPGVSPKAVAWDAVLHAAHEHAPGLYRQLTERPALPAGSGHDDEIGEEHFAGFGPRRGGGHPHGQRPGEHHHRDHGEHRRDHHRGFRERHPRPEYVYGEPVYAEPVIGEPVYDEPVVAEPVLQAWEPIAEPNGEASLEIGGLPGQASSGTWERQGRRIILRGV